MQSVDRRDYVFLVLDLLRQQVFEIEECLRPDHIVDIILVDTDVVYL